MPHWEEQRWRTARLADLSKRVSVGPTTMRRCQRHLRALETHNRFSGYCAEMVTGSDTAFLAAEDARGILPIAIGNLSL